MVAIKKKDIQTLKKDGMIAINRSIRPTKKKVRKKKDRKKVRKIIIIQKLSKQTNNLSRSFYN